MAKAESKAWEYISVFWKDGWWTYTRPSMMLTALIKSPESLYLHSGDHGVAGPRRHTAHSWTSGRAVSRRTGARLPPASQRSLRRRPPCRRPVTSDLMLLGFRPLHVRGNFVTGFKYNGIKHLFSLTGMPGCGREAHPPFFRTREGANFSVPVNN